MRISDRIELLGALRQLKAQRDGLDAAIEIAEELRTLQLAVGSEGEQG